MKKSSPTVVLTKDKPKSKTEAKTKDTKDKNTQKAHGITEKTAAKPPSGSDDHGKITSRPFFGRRESDKRKEADKPKVTPKPPKVKKPGGLFSRLRKSTTDLSEWSKNDTRLMTAIECQDNAKVQSILSKKTVDIGKVDPRGQTAFHLAAANGNVDIIETLIYHKADPNILDVHGRTPLASAAQHGQFDACKRLLQLVTDVNNVDHYKQTALHLATVQGSASCVRLLLEAKANTEITDKNGQSALHMAASRGFESICNELLKSGAFVNMQDQTGRTPVSYAAEGNYTDVCQRLIKGGANVKLVDYNGKSPIEWTNSKEIKETLNKAPMYAVWGLDPAEVDPNDKVEVGIVPLNEANGINLSMDDADLHSSAKVNYTDSEEEEEWTHIAPLEEYPDQVDSADHQFTNGISAEPQIPTKLETQLQAAVLPVSKELSSSVEGHPLRRKLSDETPQLWSSEPALFKGRPLSEMEVAPPDLSSSEELPASEWRVEKDKMQNEVKTLVSEKRKLSEKIQTLESELRTASVKRQSEELHDLKEELAKEKIKSLQLEHELISAKNSSRHSARQGEIKNNKDLEDDSPKNIKAQLQQELVQVAALQNQVMDLTKENDNLRNTAKAGGPSNSIELTAKISNLEARLAAQETQINQLKKEKTDSDQILDTLKVTLDEKNDVCKIMEQTLQNLHEHLVNLKSRSATPTPEDDLDQSCRLSDMSSDQVMDMAGKVWEELEAMRNRKNRLGEDLESMFETNDELASENEKLSKDIQQMHEQIQKMQTEDVGDVSSQLEMLRQEKEELHQLMMEINQKRNQTVEQQNGTQLDVVVKDIKEKMEELEELQTQLQTVREELKEAEMMREEIGVTHNLSKAKSISADSLTILPIEDSYDDSALQENISQIQEEKEKITRENEELRKQMQGLTQRLDELKNVVEENAELKGELGLLKIKLEQSVSQNSQFVEKVIKENEKLREEIEILEKDAMDVKEMEATVEDLKQQNDALYEDMSQLNDLLRSKDEEKRDEIAGWQHKCQQLKDDYNDLNIADQKIAAQCSELETENEKLKEIFSQLEKANQMQPKLSEELQKTSFLEICIGPSDLKGVQKVILPYKMSRQELEEKAAVLAGLLSDICAKLHIDVNDNVYTDRDFIVRAVEDEQQHWRQVEHEIAKLEMEKGDLLDRYTELEESMHVAQEEIVELSEKLEEKGSVVNVFKKDVIESHTESVQKDEDIVLKQHITQLEGQNHELSDHVEALTAQIIALKDMHEKYQEEQQNNVLHLQEDNRIYRSQMVVLREEVNTVRLESEVNKSNLMEEQQILLEKLKCMEREIEGLTQRSVTGQVITEDENEEREERLGVLEEEVQNMREQLQESTALYEQAIAEKEKLEKLVNDSKVKKDRENKELLELQRENVQLQAEVNALIRENDELRESQAITADQENQTDDGQSTEEDEEPSNPINQYELNVLKAEVDKLKQVLEENENRHKEVVNTYRTHLLAAVQGRMDPEVKNALIHIVKLKHTDQPL